MTAGRTPDLMVILATSRPTVQEARAGIGLGAWRAIGQGATFNWLAVLRLRGGGSSIHRDLSSPRRRLKEPDVRKVTAVIAVRASAVCCAS
jgi:hypothetical protein